MFKPSSLLPSWAIWVAIAAAFIASIGWGGWQRMERFAAEKELSDFRYATAVEAAKSQAEADVIYIQSLLANEEALRAYHITRDLLRAERYELRLTRPDGSKVPTLSAFTSGAAGAAGECIPLDDYKALERRAALDAAKLQAIHERDDRLAAEWEAKRQ